MPSKKESKPATLSRPVNSKLGPLIHSWSIPAGKQWSCPGESRLCAVRCYAKKGFFRMGNVKDCHVRNFEYMHNDDFADWMVSAIKGSFSQVVRIHVSGDFKTVEYLRKWRYIISKLPRVTFFAYTRSWRVEELLPELLHLTSYPNMRLWWSMDRETGPAPYIPGIRRAYMAISDVDAKLAPADCDLVFRDDPDTVLKKANGVQVCPEENGVETKYGINCSRCGICWKRATPARWEDALLPEFDPESIEIAAPVGGFQDELSGRELPVIAL